MLFLSSKAIAYRLAVEGYAVTINNIIANKASVVSLAAKLNETYSNSTFIGIIANVTLPLEVKSIIKELVKHLSPLIAIVANVGIASISATLNLLDKDVA